MVRRSRYGSRVKKVTSIQMNHVEHDKARRKATLQSLLRPGRMQATLKKLEVRPRVVVQHDDFAIKDDVTMAKE